MGKIGVEICTDSKSVQIVPKYFGVLIIGLQLRSQVGVVGDHDVPQERQGTRKEERHHQGN
jgi:hypothetical protein